MSRNADFCQTGHDEFGDHVVQDTLAGNGAALLGVERRGVVLEILNDRSGFRTFVKNLGFTLVDGLLSGHWRDLSHLGPPSDAAGTLKFAPSV